MNRYISVALLTCALAGVPILSGCGDDTTSTKTQTHTNPDGTTTVNRSSTTAGPDGSTTTTEHHTSP